MKTLRGARRFFRAFLLATALFLPGATGLFAQSFSLSEFDLELKGLEGEDGYLRLAGTVKAGGAVSFGSHFTLSASAELSSRDLRSIFMINEPERESASLKVASVAMEFPFSRGWGFVPVLFLGEYADVASDDLLMKTLKVSMRPPEFLRYGALSVFSAETDTQGLGGGLAWSAKKHPLAAAAYGTWDGFVDMAGFNVYAQFAGAWRALFWNIFGAFGRGEEDASAGLSADDFYVSGGITALVEGDANLSLYVQAKLLPFKLGSSSYLSENVERRVHLLFEPRYTGRLFSAGAAFFLTPVMQEKYVPFLDLDEDALYAGANISLEWGAIASRGMSGGLNAALFADTGGLSESGGAAWNDILRICASPFFKVKGDVFTFTVSAFVNFSKIASPLSAGEINLHLEAAL